MQPNPASLPLTPELIHHLLEKDTRAEMPAEYVRLMEIYCVVKAGGVAAQLAVSQRLEATEKAVLLAEIQTLVDQPEAAGRIRSLQQEIQELERSVANRVGYLKSISAEEEATVQACLADIDAYFQALRTNHG